MAVLSGGGGGVGRLVSSDASSISPWSVDFIGGAIQYAREGEGVKWCIVQRFGRLIREKHPCGLLFLV